MDIRTIGDLVQQVGISNAILIVVVAVIAWFFVKVLPKAVERLVSAIEGLGTTFAVHDARATAISQGLSCLQADVRDLNKNVANQDHIVRLHDRLDIYFLSSATKEDIKVILEAISKHQTDCQLRSGQIQRDVIGGHG